MASNPYSTTTNAFTLTGTSVTETSTDILALSARVHRQSIEQELLPELWHYRDSTWTFSPFQPLCEPNRGIRISQNVNEASYCEMTLLDNEGYLTIQNKESSYNYNGASAYDPYLDVNRKMLLRLGVKCYTNLSSGITPTASVAVTSGALANLTDGTFADFTGTPTDIAKWTVGGAGTVWIKVDLGAAYTVRHVVARFGTKSGTYTLPTSVLVETSADNSTWTTRKTARPISGDWDDSYSGQAIEAIQCNLDAYGARYVRFTITSTAAQTFVLDQIAVYGGNTFSWIGRNMFCGYVGDDTNITPQGVVSLRLTDVLKKLADNFNTYLTPAFTTDSSGGKDLATIASTLLTSTGLWGRKATSGYDGVVSSSDIGWYGTTVGLVFPFWQGSAGSMLSYVQGLWHGVGYNLYGDGNGKYQAAALLQDQFLPDRVFIADLDGNQDFGQFERNGSGRDLRNRVIVTTGQVQTGGGGITLDNEASQSRFGVVAFIASDPILAGEPSLMLQMASRILRDYAWRDQTAHTEIRPDFDTFVQRVYGFRAALRPSVYPKANTTMGTRRLGELWQIERIEHSIGYGCWKADAQLIPYYAGAQDPPFLVSVSSPSSSSLRATFTAISNSKVSSIEVWVSTAKNDPAFPFTLNNTISNSGSPTTIDATSLTNGVRYFVYLKTVDYRGVESNQSNTLSCVVGGSSVDNSGWTVTDFATTLETDSYDSAALLYTYRFQFDWTSPGTIGIDPANGGTKRFRIWANPISPPTDPTIADNWLITNEGAEWHGDYIAPTLMWDRSTVGKLVWGLAFSTTQNFNSGNLTGSVSGITRISTTATATKTNHGFQIGDVVTIAGATQTEYNGAKTLIGVTTDTFSYNVSGSPATPATGTITVNYKQRVYFKMWTSNMTSRWDTFFPSNTSYWTFG